MSGEVVAVTVTNQSLSFGYIKPVKLQDCLYSVLITYLLYRTFNLDIRALLHRNCLGAQTVPNLSHS